MAKKGGGILDIGVQHLNETNDNSIENFGKMVEWLILPGVQFQDRRALIIYRLRP